MTTLTIGIPHYADFDGAYFTIQSIRLHHPEILSRTELIVVDNSPHTPGAKNLKEFVESRLAGFFPKRKYIPMPGNGGPAASKDRVFRESESDAVLCTDCHVLFPPGSLSRLLDYYDTLSDDANLLTGPLLPDQPNSAWTHFDNVWRGHMWGTWGVAWTCLKCGIKFSVVQCGDMAEYRSLAADGSYVITDCGCGKLPETIWQGHEGALRASGCEEVMKVESQLPSVSSKPIEPFEVPAHGMGVFSCRREAWLGFNQHFRGFGGEEFYIHEKYRQAGRKTICLPFLQWVHRFSRPAGVPYTLRVEDKVRNYIIGHQELGLDLETCHRHFTQDAVSEKAKPISEDTWQAILEDPIAYGAGGNHAGGGCKSCRKEIEPLTLDQVFDFYLKRPDLCRDFGEHFPEIRDFAAKCEHVTEFGQRDYGVIPLLAGKPKELRSYNIQLDGAAYWKAEKIGKELGIKVTISHEPYEQVLIDETDLFFYDRDPHTAQQLYQDLDKQADRIRRFIVVHDTDIYGAKGTGGAPGLKIGLMQFMKARPEWTVIYSTTKQYGLMVLSRNPKDKPKRPSIFKMGPTFLKHMAEHVMDGLKKVPPEQLERRLEECWLCDLRTKDSQCGLCGCPLLDKAALRSSRCDANKWAAIDEEFKAAE